MSAFSYALYVVANGHTNTSRSLLLKSALIMTGSSIAIFVVGGGQIVGGFNFNVAFLYWVIGFTVFGTAIPTALFSMGIPKVGACLSSILMTVELLVAVLCASVILGERICVLQAVGIALVFFHNIYKLSRDEKGVGGSRDSADFIGGVSLSGGCENSINLSFKCCKGWRFFLTFGVWNFKMANRPFAPRIW